MFVQFYNILFVLLISEDEMQENFVEQVIECFKHNKFSIVD